MKEWEDSAKNFEAEQKEQKARDRKLLKTIILRNSKQTVEKTEGEGS
jgi:hypothetical protein